MFSDAGCTRRMVFRIGASLLFSSVKAVSAAASALPLEFTPQRSERLESRQGCRQYTIHATVMLGSVPLFSKRNVGGAALSFESAADGPSRWTALQFVAGSAPEKLRGFNRFGATREMVRCENGTVAESGYVSFMSTSREAGLSEARKAFAAQTSSQPFTFARGRATDRGCTYALEHRTVTTPCTWLNCIDVLASGPDAGQLPAERLLPDYGPRCPPTFLFALHRALGQREREWAGRYVHNGKMFSLSCVWKDADENGVRLMAGRTSAPGEHATDFKIWVATAAPDEMPIKFEYRPKPFLKLTVERADTAFSSALPPLMGLRKG